MSENTATGQAAACLPLRVTRLQETNFKRVGAVDISPGAKTLVVLKGPNEAGKTSTLDGLIAALAGKRFDPESPIRAGAENAVVEIELGDAKLRPRYRISASWTPNRRYLTVIAFDEDGQPAKLSAGQTNLDRLVSDLSFDPLAFAKAGNDAAGRKLQARMLCGAIGRPELIEQAEAKKAALAEQRKGMNTKIAGLRAELCNGSADPAPGQDLHEVTDAGVKARLDAAESQNRARRVVAGQVATADTAQRQAAAQIAAIDKQIAELQTKRQQWRAQEEQQAAIKEQKAAELAAMPAEVSTAEISAALAQVSADNERARRQKAHREKAKQLSELEVSSAGLSARLELVDTETETAISASDLGKAVPGLTFLAGGLRHNGQPLSQASGMRRLELSALIGMAANPRLRIMTIDEGDQLDDASLQRLIALARERGYQVWMTAIRAGNETDADTHVVTVRDGQAVDGEVNASKGAAGSIVPEPAASQTVAAVTAGVPADENFEL